MKEKKSFCLNKSKNGSKLIDINTLTFVALHELSHIATKSVGHGQEFWQNFKWVLQNAKAAGIYCMGYNSEHSKDQNLDEADKVINHFNELNAEVIRALN